MKQKTKNLILYIFMCVLIITSSYVLIRLNYNKKSELLQTSYIKKYLSEVKYDDIKANLIENPSLIIYVSNSGDKKSEKFEKKFSKVIKKYNLENDVYFININNLNIKDSFYVNAPELLFYQNKEVSDIIDCTLLKNGKEIVKVFRERGIIND